ncbi:MAG: PAS domain S-box protein [Proteobacteria bacterium]|nr:PAS domain S-box protein [Pseudomonadota bacterium]MBU1714143.1 PAS domain S-box protein [Pseudomonadota bacterium]
MAESLLAAYTRYLEENIQSLVDQFLEDSAGLGYPVASKADLWRQTMNQLVGFLVVFLSSVNPIKSVSTPSVISEKPLGPGAEAARYYRKEGGKFKDYFMLLKLLRQLFLAQFFKCGAITNASGPELALVNLFFDRYEYAAAVTWLAEEKSFALRRLKEARKFNLQERKRYSTIFSRMIEPAFVVDHELRIVDVNLAFEDFFGTSDRQQIGLSCAEVIGSNACKRCTLEETIRQKTSFSNVEISLPVRVVDSQGVLKEETKHVLVAGTSLGDFSDEFAGGIVILQDITEKKKIEKALHESEKKYRSLVENVPDVTWRTTEEGNYIFVSSNIEKICGHTLNELQGLNKFALIHPDEVEEVRAAYERLLSDDQIFDARYRSKKKDGEWVWVHDRASSVNEFDGQRYVDGVLWDITELKQVEEELDEYRCWLEELVDERTEDLYLSNEKLKQEIVERQQVEQKLMKMAFKLKRSNAELEQFAHVASHDLKEPLMLIVAFCDRLINRYRENLDERGREYVDRIMKAARQLQKLVDGLLQLSRISTSAKPFEHLDVTSLVREVVGDLGELINQEGGRVEIGELGDLNGDEVQIRQLFQNVIANAIKYRREEVEPLINIHGKVVGENFIEIMVEDNGMGFDEKDMYRIFHPFERLDSGKKSEGSGIGLTTCEKIVTRHGGEITARSVLGKGTTFIIRLPIQQKKIT